MIAGRRKVVKVGNSHVFSIPANFVKGTEATFAGSELILLDPTGKRELVELVELLRKVEG
jgi:antitoxin component of MazEF toxin-antitoxin module